MSMAHVSVLHGSLVLEIQENSERFVRKRGRLVFTCDVAIEQVQTLIGEATVRSKLMGAAIGSRRAASYNTCILFPRASLQRPTTSLTEPR